MGFGLIKSNRLISNMTVFVFITMLLLRTAAGFLCYKCSYSIWSEGDLTDCIDKPEALGSGNVLHCNSTSYCVFSEHFRLNDRTIESYFRTCSGTSWGNQCDSDQSHLTCKGSCQGDLCNKGERGDRHIRYLETHKRGNHHGNNAARSKGMTLTLTTCLVVLLMSL